MGSKPKQKESNYMNMLSYRNHPWVRSNYETATGIALGPAVELTPQQALRYGGGIPCNCIEIHFRGMPVLRLTDNAIDVQHNGVVYRATPDLQSVKTQKSKSQINSQGGRVTLSAVDDVFIELVDTAAAHRAEISFRVALMDPDNNCLAMFTEHRGWIKFPSIRFNHKSGELTVEFETTNWFEMLDQIPGVRPADSVQKFYWPQDTAFEHSTVQETEEWKVKQ
ncbi:hypothetical protein R6I31_000038 [Vibrio cholerae]|uniref:hypothetical protein n=1 Tax=Vibrio cholerae TaxID=666 RepID=UPI001E5F566E|nr:hypothetical protein [Vibrio cholerae]EGQ9960027.1 DUF2163 domain-containing protein [Vibrio cholerae]EJL6479684.1 hypothetical protein [Vibrio cholerae]EJL6830124.1 hypothetical protein [Vibrio cholerae]EJL7007707.1 hypothetical protein [Vibrio cholerae]EKF9698730.1 hypothetical protein [Vibrio cholerae]